MGSQRFCLRWNNHQSNLLSVFDQLLHDEAFVDVTLAVEGQLLRAHKMVLSACSPYFQALFVGHPDKHPIVILKDVPYSDMRSLLDFMYRGEVSVDQDRLTAFLKVAESLRIKGLTEVNEERCDLPSIANSLLNQTPLPPPPPPPSLHRLPMPANIVHKRLPQNPMLNSALTAPKRKRGRPRKLSGSSPNRPANLHSEMDHEDQKQTPVIDNHLGAVVPYTPIQGHHHQHPHQQQHPPHHPTHLHQQQINLLPMQQDSGISSFRITLPSASPSRISQPNNVNSNHTSNNNNSTITNNNTSNNLNTPTSQPAPPPAPPDEPESPKMEEDDDDDCEDVAKMEEAEADEDGLDDEEQSESQHQSAKADDPKPSTSGQDSLTSFQSSTQSDGERFSSSEECLQSVSVSICDDVSITPFPSRSDSVLQEELEDAPISSEDVTINPVQFTPHFLSHEALIQVKEESAEETEDDSPGETTPRRKDLLEYYMNEDGSVVCKRCGELLPSRTQWYRHKYKFHIEAPPATLFKCYRCNVFFKSRKGYLGHLSTRHSKMEERVVIPVRRGRRASEDIQGNPAEYEKQREKEEKLVADIIDRVKRECEAQGSTVSRKGYSRRSTIMNT